MDSLHLCETQELFLSQEGMHFNLQNCWFNLGILDDVDNFNTSDIANSNIPHQAISNELLHCSPSLLVSHCVIWLHSRVSRLRIVDPLWRVSDLRVNILQRNGEVDKIKINIVETKILKSSFAGRSDVLRVMECIPEFRNHKELFSLDDALVNSSFYS